MKRFLMTLIAVSSFSLACRSSSPTAQSDSLQVAQTEEPQVGNLYPWSEGSKYLTEAKELAAKHGVEDWFEGDLTDENWWTEITDTSKSNYMYIERCSSKDKHAEHCSEDLNQLGKKRTNQHNLPGIKILATMLAQRDGNYAAHCQAITPPYWSDIQAHFYCQYGNARGCYSGMARNLYEDETGPKVLSRAEMAEACRVFNPAGKLRGSKGTYKTYQKDFTNQVMNQRPSDRDDTNTYNHFPVFRYIMTARTFAFPFKQQQKIINAFYDVADPDVRSECLKRPIRNFEIHGKNCSLDKDYPIDPGTNTYLPSP